MEGKGGFSCRMEDLEAVDLAAADLAADRLATVVTAVTAVTVANLMVVRRLFLSSFYSSC